MAEHLSQRGYSVSVATTYAHYPSWDRPTGVPPASRERHAGVQIRRRWLYVPQRQTTARRAAYELSMFTAGLTALPQRRPDVVLGFIPSLAAGALTALAGKLYRRPYGLVIHDLVGPGARQSGLAGDAVARGVSRTELDVARGAASVAIIADGFRDYFERVGGIPADRLVRVRTWTRRTEPSETRDQVRRELGWRPDDFVCLHAGNMGLKQDLDNVLDAARLVDGRGVRFVLLGDGNDRERLQQRAKELSIGSVSFLDFAGPGRYEAILQAADVLLVNQGPSVGDMSLPSKLTSYFAAGQPVVAAIAPDSETAREIRAAHGGVLVPPAHPEALADGVLALREDPALREALGRHGRQFAEDVLAPEHILSAYEDLVRRIHATG
jgi:glycosyltransferase involved in cell wall biosynthesis